MKKKLLVTGAKGFVGGSIIRQAGEEWETHAIVRGEIPSGFANITWRLLDLNDEAGVEKVFDDIRPDAVIHAAAAADIDFCEKNREAAYATNVGLTQRIARLCSATGVRLVHCSTDTVFDGEKGLYKESDPPGPVNYYAETKVEAERIAVSENENTVVPRLSLVMGLPLLGGGNSFLSRMIASLKESKPVGVPEDEIRTPVDVITLGAALLELAGGVFRGFVHLAGNDRMNRYEMSLRIADRLGFPRDLIVSKNSCGIPGRAKRPVDVSMDNSLAQSILKTKMLGLEAGLERVLNFDKGERQ
ncbi:MAG TPA: SDR family oxidoreductase [bacterium]|nr:SDR family oxidoreductase [bacterium]